MSEHCEEVRELCAREYLEYVRSLGIRIHTLREKIEHQRSVIMPNGIAYQEKVARSRDIDGFESAVIGLQELIADYCTELAEYVEQQEIASGVLRCLSKYEYGVALTKHYLLGQTWEKVRLDMGYSWQGIMKIRKKGIDEVYDLMPESWRRDPIPNAF